MHGLIRTVDRIKRQRFLFYNEHFPERDLNVAASRRTLRVLRSKGGDGIRVR